MNPVIETIVNHRSIRDFEDKQLSDDQIMSIVNCAQAGSTSSFIQAYSIIGVNDVEKKKKLAQLAGNQSYVEKNGHFFVFCADLHRHDVIAELEGADLEPSLESTEKFMVSLIDATIAAQNAALAAESMGLGICYIGGIRNNLEAVCDVLQTPKHVVPLFGLAVGYPKTNTGQKPRLPFANVYHENVYQQDRELYKNQLEQYNETISEYYQERTKGARKDSWTGQMSNMLKEPKRMYMKQFVEGKGLNKK
ncbi:oxygen-insensitive NADPH nitroreductase [Bacillus sp. BGMRC 2118]|nr:oxygen-insensitive NADPH nitroreductase [Bacillus sp. BGMRC 2118]